MPKFEADSLQRQIRQLGDAVAAIVARVRVAADYESGLEAIRDAAAKGLGPDRSLLDKLDAGSASQLLREPARTRMYAQVCVAEAEMLERLGRLEEATRLKARAASLEEAVRDRGSSG
jgi:hypothetical protein